MRCSESCTERAADDPISSCTQTMFKCKRRNIAYTCAVDSVPVVDVPGLVVELEDHIGVSVVELAVMVGGLFDWLELFNSVDFEV